MKKLAILMMLMICSNSFTQKKELRQINKLISESFFNEAENQIMGTFICDSFGGAVENFTFKAN